MTGLSRAHIKSQRNWIIAVFFFAFLLYANSIRNRFALDDRYVTVTNPEYPDNARVAKGLAGIPEIFTTHYVQDETQTFEYRPLPMAMFAIEYQFFGSNPHVNHFFNVVFYAATCALLLTILLHLLPGQPMLTLVISFFFAAHPIHTEVVNNIKCRDELMSFFFGLLAVNYFLRFNEKSERKWIRAAQIILFILLALLSKKTAVLFIGMMVLMAWFFGMANKKQMLLSAAAILGGFVLYFLVVRMMLGGAPVSRKFTFYENPLFYEHGLLNRVHYAFFTTGYYARLLLLPFPLCFYYGYEAVSLDGIGWMWTILSFVFHGALLFFLGKHWREKKIVSLGISIYVLGLIPFANFFLPVVGIFGERFMYFSSLGFAIMMASFLFDRAKTNLQADSLKNLSPSLKRYGYGVVAVFSLMVLSRNTAWKDLLTLSATDAKHFENSYMLQSFMGNNLLGESARMPEGIRKRAIAQEAQQYLNRAASILAGGVAMHPEDYYSLTTLGALYSVNLGRVDEAMQLFEKALQQNSRYDIARYNLVYCYKLKNKPDTAIKLYRQMLQSGSNYNLIYLRLHELLVEKSDYKNALENDLSGLQKHPENIQLVLNTGNAYMMLADTANGLKYFERAANLAPNEKGLQLRVAETFRLVGQGVKANEYFQRAQRLPDRAREKN